MLCSLHRCNNAWQCFSNSANVGAAINKSSTSFITFLSPCKAASVLERKISDEIPDSEHEIWNQEHTQEQASEENWEDQDDLDDFQPQESEFKTIDELMAEVESEEDQSVDEELKLDVGLNEFPDVIGDIGDVDVDANSEAAGKLDLAKIYIEMNDSKGAIKLLEEAIVDGSDEIRQEAKKLIDDINGSTV